MFCVEVSVCFDTSDTPSVCLDSLLLLLLLCGAIYFTVDIVIRLQD